MKSRLIQLACALLAASAPLALAVCSARAEGLAVDLALVLAVDVSYSMDPDEQELQRQGFIEAFRSQVVQDAVRKGILGRIAVTYLEWSSVNDQKVIVPWMIVDGGEGAGEFAERLAQAPTRRAARTSISGAIDFSLRLLGKSGVEAARQVIDISGDGANNQGRPVTAARDEAVARGITINGLPIMLKAPGYFDIEHLDRYYRDCVIGGPGAFMVPAREREQFVQAIRTKIIREIAAGPGSLVHRVQTETTRANCLEGEQMWQDRFSR